MKQARDPATLKFALQDSLLYELAMLGGTYDRLQKLVADPVVRNALMESFAIHARLLFEFFDGKQGVRAYEFTGGSYNPLYLSVPGARLCDELREKLNEQIAHLSPRRLGADKIDRVDRALLLQIFVQEAAHFLTKLDHSFVSLITVQQGDEIAVHANSVPTATNHVESITVVIAPLGKPKGT